jgi:hypothetical protein
VPLWAWIALGIGGYILFGGGMGANQVPPTPTPVSAAQMYAALSAAWPSVIGGQPSRESLLVLLAQWSLETGGGASMIQWNVGNFKASSAAPLYTTYLTTEYVNGQPVKMTANFAAWPSLQAGVTAYLSAMQGQFGSAWQYVLSGDVDGFAQALSDAGYYTAPEATYAAGLEARYNALDAQIPGGNGDGDDSA